MMDVERMSTSVTPVVEYFMNHPRPHQGPTMLYQSFSELDQSRLPDVIEGITGADDMFSETNEADTLLQTGKNTRINTHITKDQEHHADVMLGLLYMMVGGADEAHDLVLPYSLPSDTEWGGPAVLDSPALGSASYCHALVHRSEGVHLGELGLCGWDNARTWFEETPRDHLLFDKVSGECERLHQQMNFTSDDLKVLDRIKGHENWNCNTMVDLFSFSDSSSAITMFCNDLHNKEILMLLKHCNDIINKVKK